MRDFRLTPGILPQSLLRVLRGYMPSRVLATLATVIGWFVIIAVPTVFFVFGWKDIELNCHRQVAGGLPSCTISESFGMGLYTRSVSADRITQISYNTGTVRQPSTKVGMVTVHTSTMVFGTEQGEVMIGHVTSAIDTSAEKELILNTRKFLNDPGARSFSHRASMHGLFAYVGLVGVVGLLFIFAAVLWYHLRRIIS